MKDKVTVSCHHEIKRELCKLTKVVTYSVFFPTWKITALTLDVKMAQPRADYFLSTPY